MGRRPPYNLSTGCMYVVDSSAAKLMFTTAPHAVCLCHCIRRNQQWSKVQIESMLTDIGLRHLSSTPYLQITPVDGSVKPHFLSFVFVLATPERGS